MRIKLPIPWADTPVGPYAASRRADRRVGPELLLRQLSRMGNEIAHPPDTLVCKLAAEEIVIEQLSTVVEHS